MNCAVRNCVYAFTVGFFVLTQSVASLGKDGREGKSIDVVTPSSSNSATSSNSASPSEFQWNEHRKLSWDDFRGAVNAASEESAAATHCGIGFRTAANSTDGKPEIIVYNTFYVNKSWVKPDAKISTILDHEQGHFDLCEIYTRKLKARMNNFDFNTGDLKQQLLSIYTEVSNEYETRQQAYEQETVHGTNTAQQKKWQNMIIRELL
jgi:hypothetical protein